MGHGLTNGMPTLQNQVPNDQLKSCNAVLKALASLLIWLDKDMCWHGTASSKRGRVPKYSKAAVPFGPSIKGLFNLPLRQAMGRTRSLPESGKVDWRVPDFSTVSRRQKQLSATIGVQPMTTRLHLLVGSTGIKMLGEGKWKTKKHGADDRRQWRKVHLGLTRPRSKSGPLRSLTTLPAMHRYCRGCSTRFRRGDDRGRQWRRCLTTRRLSRSDCATWGAGDQPHAQEQQAVEGPASWCQGAQGHFGEYAPVWPEDLEEVERVSSAQPCRDQNALLHAAW